MNRVMPATAARVVFLPSLTNGMPPGLQRDEEATASNGPRAPVPVVRMMLDFRSRMASRTLVSLATETRTATKGFNTTRRQKASY